MRQSRCRLLSERSEFLTFMRSSPWSRRRACAFGFGVREGTPPCGEWFMVGDTRFELVTPSMSTKCSTTELIARTDLVFSSLKTKRDLEISLHAFQTWRKSHALPAYLDDNWTLFVQTQFPLHMDSVRDQCRFTVSYVRQIRTAL